MMLRLAAGMVALLVTLAFAACKNESDSSDTKIVGGEELARSPDRRAFSSTLAIYARMPEAPEMPDMPGSPDMPDSRSEQSPALAQQFALSDGKPPAPAGMVGSCTGTLIGPNHVVTAAHCVVGVDAIGIGVGDKMQGPAPGIKITGFTPHPRYHTRSQRGEFDIAVISFTGQLPPEHKPVALADPEAIKVGSDLLLAGFGLTVQTDDSTFGTLRQVKVKVATIDNTTRLLGIETYTKRGGCNGDSGGPAYYDDGGTLKLVGATSGPTHGMEEVKCDEGHGIWAMVHKYQGWMKCAFTALGYPLAGLADDASKDACNVASTATYSKSQDMDGGATSPTSTFTSVSSTPYEPETIPTGTYVATSRQVSQWCDAYQPNVCFPYCTNGSDTGGGFGYQEDLGGSCKVP